MKPVFTIGAFGMIFDDRGRVLLCHRRDYDLWNLPGGGVEQGESPWDAVGREIKEETGLDVTSSRLAGIYGKPQQNEIVFSFVCTITGGTITTNEEADRIEYFAPDALPPNTSPKQAERIRDAVRDPNIVHMKSQTGKSSIELIKERKL